ncbi:MAG: hypothetical protein J07HX5_01234 [halophilic archaeon J07HX5]|nr:MAG: hypothetical protein J07HX5_01234 [halophilic archaeon J07HX5]
MINLSVEWRDREKIAHVGFTPGVNTGILSLLQIADRGDDHADADDEKPDLDPRDQRVDELGPLSG